MNPEGKYPFLKSLLSIFWKRHRKTLALVIAAIATTGQARSFAIATTMARWLGTQLGSAVNRLYRLLRNSRIDYLDFTSQWAALLARPGERHLLVSIDWTEWHHGLRLLVAAAVAGKRALPLFAQGWRQLVNTRSQNSRENTFLRLLVDAVRRVGVSITVLCDRGFRRASWISLLQQLQVSFVVRLMDDVLVELADHTQVALQHIVLTQGQVLDLGVVPLRADGVTAVRIIGYWAPGADEPWWLATSETGPARHALRLYDRRMTVEEQFRDLKGRRFGVKLFWTQFRDPEALARFVMLLAVALLIWLIAGIAAAQRDASLRLVSRSKGPRQSYVTIGLREVWLDPGSGPLGVVTVRQLLETPTLRRVGKDGVGGK